VKNVAKKTIFTVEAIQASLRHPLYWSFEIAQRTITTGGFLSRFLKITIVQKEKYQFFYKLYLVNSFQKKFVISKF
jgi:hypothetical protein